MTTDKPETFRSHLPALAGSLIGTLLSAVIGSHVGGALGTRYALIFGAFISGSASWWAERAIRRSHEITKAKVTAARRRGRELTEHETQLIERAYRSGYEKRSRGIPYRLIAILSLSALAVCFITVYALDVLGARSVANITPEPRPAVTRTVIIEPTTATEPVSQTPTVIPDLTPTVVPSATMSPSASVTASATPAPFADSTPTDSPTDTTTPTTGATP